MQMHSNKIAKLFNYIGGGGEGVGIFVHTSI